MSNIPGFFYRIVPPAVCLVFFYCPDFTRAEEQEFFLAGGYF